MDMTQDEFVKQEWREKADRRTLSADIKEYGALMNEYGDVPAVKISPRTYFKISMLGIKIRRSTRIEHSCNLCGDADCWEAACMSNCEGCGLNNAQPNPDCQCKPGARKSTRIAHGTLIE